MSPSPMVVSFDWDDTLVELKTQKPTTLLRRLCEHIKRGDTVMIVTARSNNFESVFRVRPPREWLAEWGLSHIPVHRTNWRLKGPTLRSLDVDLHYDDRDAEIRSAREHGVSTIQVRLPG
jgi:acid phosphatase class B